MFSATPLVFSLVLPSPQLPNCQTTLSETTFCLHVCVCVFAILYECDPPPPPFLAPLQQVSMFFVMYFNNL